MVKYAEMPYLRINCDVFQFFLAFFMLLRNNPPPLVVPNGLSRLCTVLISVISSGFRIWMNQYRIGRAYGTVFLFN